MHRSTWMLFAGLLLALTTGAVALPLWPAAEATYIKEAGVQLDALRQAADAGMQGLSSGDVDSAALLADIDAVIEYFNDNQAPPKLAPVGLAGHYAAQTCRSAIGYFGELPADAAGNPFAMPMLYSMATNCQSAIHAADMEIARVVAIVGAWPPAPAPPPTPTP